MIAPALLHISERLSESLVADTLHALVLLALVASALKLLRGVGAATRSLVWTLVLLLVIAFPWLPPGPAAAHLAALPHVRLAPGWSLALAAVWLLFALARIAGLLRNALRLRSIWRSATPIPGSIHSTFPALGRARTAELCLSNSVDRPSIIGFLAPRILVPAQLYSRLTALELDQIVLHEMEHLRRRDDWRNLVQKLALVVFPLHPALLWIDRRLAVERELACDESVLEATRAPRSYASCLVHLAEQSLLGRQVSLALGAWERRSELGRRVDTILSYRPGSTPGRARGRSCAVALACAATVVACLLARTPGFISFSAPEVALVAASPLHTDVSNVPAAAGTYREASMVVSNAHEANAPRVVEAVARMPERHPAAVSATSAKAVQHPNATAPKLMPRQHRTHRAERAPYLLTSWLISGDFDAPDETRQVRLILTVFRLPAPLAGPQFLSSEPLPAMGSVLLIPL